ncbi:hypothetical protein AC249_AIPGENE7142 [Exaiptasia diaphana]|nr:hypothetical protein AC249_AIPGENE7142 [Exaiptasia diaphana]
MRTRNNPEKVGEIFRKNLGKSNTEKEKEQSERRKKRQKKSHHKENSRKTNQNTPKKKPTEQGSIITKHRITSKVGLYNKAKSSKTVLRDQKVEDNMKKCVPDHEEELKKDLSRVLDCSSFRIKPLIASSGYISTEMTASSDIPISVPRQFSGRGSLNSSPRSIATVRSSACGSAVSNCSQSSQGRLPFKTPLHEISESLIASLHPAETFHGRNYFMEVREQILKVFKQRLDGWMD